MKVPIDRVIEKIVITGISRELLEICKLMFLFRDFPKNACKHDRVDNLSGSSSSLSRSVNNFWPSISRDTNVEVSALSPILVVSRRLWLLP